MYRSYSHPQPSPSLIRDAISSFLCSLHSSLNVGTIRCCKFSIEFRIDIYNFLFDGKGSKPTSGKGLLYYQDDFHSEYFSEDWFLSYDRLGNGCCVDFPIRMQPTLKQGPTRYLRRNSELVKQKRVYLEYLVVNIVKCRC